MDKKLDYTLLFRIAKAYYVDNKTQQEIAEVENFSRSQISRLLKRALDEKLVRYTLNFPMNVDGEALQEQLRLRLGIDQVVLVPSFYQSTGKSHADEICKNLALGVADQLHELLGDCKTVGIGWGRAVYNASLYVRPHKFVKGRTFVPLIGLSGDSNPMLQVNTIVDRFGERFHAERKYVNMQSIRPRELISRRDQECINDLKEKWKDLDAAIVGIGGAPTGTKNLIPEFPRSYKRQIQGSGTVGDILAQFFYENGQIFDMDSRFHLLALDIHRLREVGNVIAIATGTEKCKAIYCASKLKLIKTLVTDYDTAKAILAVDHQTKE